MAQFKTITVKAANINSESATDGQVLTANGFGGSAFEDPTGSGVTYNVYAAFLQILAGNDPVPTVVENTLGGTIVWTRTALGTYSGTLTGAFTADKTFILGSAFGAGDDGELLYVSLYPLSEDVIGIYTSLLSTNELFDCASTVLIEIRVYP